MAKNDQMSERDPGVEGLARAAATGDKRAFVEIVTRYQGMVTGVALAILRDFAASEDVAQEAFVTAWKKMAELRDPARLPAWLGTIARTTALMHLRKRRDEETLDEGVLRSECTGGPDEEVAHREEAALVLSALEALPENYRLPLVLFYREQNSVKAVAEALDLTEATVRQRLSRGREMLRERVSGLIDTVLSRTTPTAVFTMAVAMAIGALTAPGVIAAGAFAATAATTTAGATATAVSSTQAGAGSALAATTTATMSTSKISMAAAAIAAVCIPVGYTARLTTEEEKAPLPVAAKVESPPVTPVEKGESPELPDTALVAEWKRLLEEYGEDGSRYVDLFQRIEAMDDPFRKRAFQSALIAKWVEIDPDKGLTFFRSEEAKKLRWQRDLFLREWLERDPRAAVAALVASGEGWQKLAHDQLLEIARRLPGKVPELVAEFPKPRNVWDERVRNAFEIVAKFNLMETLEAAQKLQGPNRLQALAGVALAWGERDGLGALKWAEGIKDEGERVELIRNLLMGWARVDPASALERVHLVPIGGNDMYFASSTGAKVLQEASKGNFEATLEWLKQNPNKLGHEDLIGLSREVGPRLTADPVGFLSHHLENESLQPLMRAISSALLNDAASMRLPIWEWLETLPESEMVAQLRQQVLGGMGWQFPEVAMELVNEMPAGTERTERQKSIARQIVNGGRNTGTVDRLLPQVSKDWQAQLIEAGFQTLRPEYFHDAQKWVQRLNMLEPAQRPSAVRSLARAWSNDDPEGSAQWASTLSDPGERRAGLESVASEWARTDPQGVEEWVNELPAEHRQAGVIGLAGGLAQSDPGRAWEWVEGLEAQEARSTAAERVVGTMMSRDRDNARRWLEQARISAREKEPLLKMLEGRQRP